ncbi:MAG: hypothetical protein K9J25_01025 [Bacteroidales bacterium]|nr:hypothetical protein [Bacteroidales bacterium]
MIEWLTGFDEGKLQLAFRMDYTFRLNKILFKFDACKQ